MMASRIVTERPPLFDPSTLLGGSSLAGDIGPVLPAGLVVVSSRSSDSVCFARVAELADALA
ncbi:MAG: hypothetical protein WD400_00905 [Pontimonas sp.]